MRQEDSLSGSETHHTVVGHIGELPNGGHHHVQGDQDINYAELRNYSITSMFDDVIIQMRHYSITSLINYVIIELRH